jgi:hypothetical protein
VTAQPTPPVNPAPPGGARREARQRQAATAKSEEGGGADNPAHGRADNAEAPHSAPGSSMTRLDARRPEANAYTRRASASPVLAARMAVHSGGSGPTAAQTAALAFLSALAVGLAFAAVRPTPRRRPPIVPAPGWQRPRRH